MTEITEIVQSLNNLADKSVGLTTHNVQLIGKAIEILQHVEEIDLLESRLQVTSTIWQYFVTSQGSPHSQLLRDGVRNFCTAEDFTDKATRAFIIVGTNKDKESFVSDMADENKGNYICVSLDEMKSGIMNGRTKPLAWHHTAIVRIMSQLSIVQTTFRKIRQTLAE